MTEKIQVVGYLRVSTVDQDTEKNKADILNFANNKGIGPVEWISEKISGKTDWKKRKIAGVIDRLGKKDVIIVPELSRLGRSTLDVLEIIKIAKEKGIEIYSVKGNIDLSGNGMQAKIMATILSLVAELERDFISMRTKEGLRAARAKGVKLGRPKGPGKSKLDQFRLEIETLLANGSTKKFIADRYGVSVPTFYNWLKKNDIKILKQS
jgi:DNA invertase Pin-like site-specific DNA recombinase